MIDITQVLRAAMEKKPEWSAHQAGELALALAADDRSSVDWDDGAGEDWMSVVTTTARIAIVSVSLPLAFLLEEGVPQDVATSAGVVRIPAFDEECLSCDPDVYAGAFRYATGDLSFEAFSAWDLWYDTI